MRTVPIRPNISNIILFSLCLAEKRGFEPPLGLTKHDFESCAFNHSATSPYWGIIA